MAVRHSWLFLPDTLLIKRFSDTGRYLLTVILYIN
jgi:hypothetical protein